MIVSEHNDACPAAWVTELSRYIHSGLQGSARGTGLKTENPEREWNYTAPWVRLRALASRLVDSCTVDIAAQVTADCETEKKRKLTFQRASEPLQGVLCDTRPVHIVKITCAHKNASRIVTGKCAIVAAIR